MFTGAGYNIVWSYKRGMFAVISFTDDSMEAFDVNGEALNHPVAKQKLTQSNIKSSVVVYKIQKDKLKKVFVYQKCRCYHLYDQGPVLGMCISYEMKKEDDSESANILEPHKALVFMSWKTLTPITSPVDAPEHLLWSSDCKHCVM